ncbi:restriction endonuclease subunit S, partial [Candidatus Microgenomates bacterium]|nr:restriction endonuclease subunit S [Candidatus Microgenomates bacterium]
MANNNQIQFKETEIGAIPAEWDFDELKNHAEILMGQSPESLYYNESGDGALFLQGVRTFGEKYPTYDTWTTKVTKLAKAGSVLLSVRAPVGEVNIAQNDLCIGRGLMSVNGKNNEFIYQLFKAFNSYIVSKETGTVYGSVTKDDIANIKLPFPQLPEQQEIAEILSSLDDKIELNRQMNKTLESIAQSIFKR